jgi:predicted 3-demethylubiquinone-9 3-methyltransferase (glyoxalase superfamily)
MEGTMQTIIPHLWYATEAKEAAAFYTTLFLQSIITNVITLENTPSGDCDVVSFEVWGYAFQAISAGPRFTFNPSVSFMVNFDPLHDPDAQTRIDAVWAQLAADGQVLMPLGQYPFSKRYGWVQDRYGLSWQLILTDPAGEERPPIIPSLLFAGDVCGKAEAASDFYLSVFKRAHRGALARYPAGMEPDREGTVMFTDFTLAGQWFAAMDSARTHHGTFNEAISFMVRCDTQDEIDEYWEALSAVPDAEQCGWLKDKYGLSWQIVPRAMDTLLARGDPEQRARVTAAFLQMKKFDLTVLTDAAQGR